MKEVDVVRPPISVIAIDDHALILEAVRSLFDGRNDMVLVGYETTGSRGLKLARKHAPDVAIIDIALRDMDGFVVVQRVTNEVPSAKIVILSTVEDRSSIRRAFEIGAKAFVSTRSPGERLLQAITAVLENGLYVDPIVASNVLRSSDDVPAPGADRALTEREAEVLRLTALGYTMKDIATGLGCTVKSIETSKRRACKKLDLDTRRELVRYACARGWLAAI